MQSFLKLLKFAIEQKSDDGTTIEIEGRDLLSLWHYWAHHSIATEQRNSGKNPFQDSQKLNHCSRNNDARHLQIKNSMIGSCLTSLLNIQTSIYKNLCQKKTLRKQNLKQNLKFNKNPAPANTSKLMKVDEYHKRLMKVHCAKREFFFF